MKKIIFIALVSFGTSVAYCQEHFSGISTSNKVGIMNASLNPAELVNITNNFDITVFSVSANISNNKIGFKDLIAGKNLEELIFQGNEPVNLRVDAQAFGPSLAMKYNKWGFGFITKVNAKLDIVDADVKLGNAINTSSTTLFGSNSINNNYNQKVTGTTWGEVGLSAARNLYEDAIHKFSAGVTFNLLFPGSYANLGLDKFQGTIDYKGTNIYLNDTYANLNIAYSGNLANNFTKFNDYGKSLIGGLNGLATDIGVNYQWKDKDNDGINNKYKLNAGASFRNMGSMTFKKENNSSTNYNLEIPRPTLFQPGLDLNQFQNTNSLQDIETKLINSGYLKKTQSTKDFKIKMPAVFSAYADVKIIPKLFVTGFIQQKLNASNSNDQIAAQNVVSIIPRFSTNVYEVYSSWTISEISGTSGGVGFRVAGFYIGSGSVITALISDTKQIDVHIGYKVGFL